MNDIGEREKIVLQSLILEYIDRASPVASHLLSKKYLAQLSPATIRNVLADLEELGYLRQPHTSAGRIPTAKGFRFYVDTLVRLAELKAAEKEELQRTLGEPQEMELNELLRRVSQALANLSHQVSLVLTPGQEVDFFHQINFIRLREKTVLAVLVSGENQVQNRLLHLQEDLPQHELDQMGKYLAEKLSGLSIQEVKAKILAEMQEEKVQYDRLVQRALRLASRALKQEEDPTLLIEGQAHLLQAPEASDIELMRSICRACERKGKLIQLLDQAMRGQGVKIFIGSEIVGDEAVELGLIASTYQHAGRALGTLGVIGPVRMDYSRIIPLVEFTAEAISSFLCGRRED